MQLPTTHPPALPASGKGAPTTSLKKEEDTQRRFAKHYQRDDETGQTSISGSCFSCRLSNRAANLLRTRCANLIEAAGM